MLWQTTRLTNFFVIPLKSVVVVMSISPSPNCQNHLQSIESASASESRMPNSPIRRTIGARSLHTEHTWHTRQRRSHTHTHTRSSARQKLARPNRIKNLLPSEATLVSNSTSTNATHSLEIVKPNTTQNQNNRRLKQTKINRRSEYTRKTWRRERIKKKIIDKPFV